MLRVQGTRVVVLEQRKSLPHRFFNLSSVCNLVCRMDNNRRALFGSFQHFSLKLAPVADFNLTSNRFAVLDYKNAPSVAVPE